MKSTFVFLISALFLSTLAFPGGVAAKHIDKETKVLKATGHAINDDDDLWITVKCNKPFAVQGIFAGPMPDNSRGEYNPIFWGLTAILSEDNYYPFHIVKITSPPYIEFNDKGLELLSQFGVKQPINLASDATLYVLGGPGTYSPSGADNYLEFYVETLVETELESVCEVGVDAGENGPSTSW